MPRTARSRRPSSASTSAAVSPTCRCPGCRRGSAGARRWDAERAKNALRTYLKLMRWRRALPFAAALLAKTLAKIALRRAPDLPAAWGWNWRHLGETLAYRRELMRYLLVRAEVPR